MIGKGVPTYQDPDDPNYFRVALLNRGDGWFWLEDGEIQRAPLEFIHLAESKGLLYLEGATSAGTITGYVRMTKPTPEEKRKYEQRNP